MLKCSICYGQKQEMWSKLKGSGIAVVRRGRWRFGGGWAL